MSIMADDKYFDFRYKEEVKIIKEMPSCLATNRKTCIHRILKD